MPALFTIQTMAWREALPLARPVRERVFIDEQKVPREPVSITTAPPVSLPASGAPPTIAEAEDASVQVQMRTLATRIMAPTATPIALRSPGSSSGSGRAV